MKLAIIGSRGISGIDISPCVPDGVDAVVSGGAVGVDRMGEEWARKNSVRLIRLLPDYGTHGRKAPLERDKQIVDCADAVLSIWDGKSSGTWFTMNYAKRRGKEVILYVYDGESLLRQLFSEVGW